MKLPLEIEHNNYGEFVGIFDADEKRQSLSALVDYINAHATHPGPPKEDGVWEILTHNGHEYIAKNRTKINGRWYWECGVNYIRDEDVVAHRKHIPLEVPNG